MKPENIATTRAATLYITYKSLIRYTVLAALCLTATTQTNATLMAISFDDGGNNTGTGVIDVEGGYAVSGGFTVTAGLAAGDWTLLDGTASSPGSGSSPNGYFNYDNMVFLGSDPYLTSNGGLLFTNADGDQLNIWADAADTYSMWAASSSGGSYYVEAGSYPGFSGATGFGTSTITNAPAGTGVTPSSTAPAPSIQPACQWLHVALAGIRGNDLPVSCKTRISTTTNWVVSTNEISLINGNEPGDRFRRPREPVFPADQSPGGVRFQNPAYIFRAQPGEPHSVQNPSRPPFLFACPLAGGVAAGHRPALRPQFENTPLERVLGNSAQASTGWWFVFEKWEPAKSLDAAFSLR